MQLDPGLFDFTIGKGIQHMQHRVLKCLAIAVVSVSAEIPALAQDLISEARLTAEIIVRMERPVQKRDQKAFCTVMTSASGFDAYQKRACESGVRNKVKKPEECSEANLKLEAKRDTDRCLGLSAADFEDALVPWRTAKEKFIKDAAAKGLDGEKLLQEERVKLR
jgi:hypothetical protein